MSYDITHSQMTENLIFFRFDHDTTDGVDDRSNGGDVLKIKRK